MIIDEKRAGEVVKSGEWLKILFDDMTLSCGGDMVIRIDDLESMLNNEMGMVNGHAIDVYRMETWDREKKGRTYICRGGIYVDNASGNGDVY